MTDEKNALEAANKAANPEQTKTLHDYDIRVSVANDTEQSFIRARNAFYITGAAFLVSVVAKLFFIKGESKTNDSIGQSTDKENQSRYVPTNQDSFKMRPFVQSGKLGIKFLF